jgi:hypothetical protein
MEVVVGIVQMLQEEVDVLRTSGTWRGRKKGGTLTTSGTALLRAFGSSMAIAQDEIEQARVGERKATLEKKSNFYCAF